MTLKQLAALKAAANKLVKGSIDYHRAMMDYHNEAAEYYDSRIGDWSNNDDEYSDKWEYHTFEYGEHDLAIRRIEKAAIKAQKATSKNYKLTAGSCTVRLSTGNRKMSDTLIFNLPAKRTCPGSTALCRQSCYACKAERCYKEVIPSREANLTASQDLLFIDAVSQVIKKHFKGHAGHFRIHESGDFYNQKYFDKWATIAAMSPEIKFLAFTKSYQLDFSQCPDNLQLIYSVWPDTEVIVEGLPISYAGDCKVRNTANTLECPGECTSCRACWSLGGRDVHFDIH